MFDLQGKTAIVTGGANGIGQEYVVQLLKNGVKKVLIADMDVKNGEANTKKLNTEYGKDTVIFVKTDVTNVPELEAAFAKANQAFGGLDIVINNAGILMDGRWELMININVNAVVRGSLLGLKYMGVDQGGRGGVIVNIASILGLAPMAGCPIYVGTKHAVVGLTRSFAQPYHYNRTKVSFLTMCPGVTDTPLISEAHDFQLNAEFSTECQRELDSLPKQSVVAMGIGMIHLIRNGDNGSVWVCEGSQPIYEVEIPDRTVMRKKK